jgi:hypothetical protein
MVYQYIKNRITQGTFIVGPKNPQNRLTFYASRKM